MLPRGFRALWRVRCGAKSTHLSREIVAGAARRSGRVCIAPASPRGGCANALPLVAGHRRATSGASLERERAPRHARARRRTRDGRGARSAAAGRRGRGRGGRHVIARVDRACGRLRRPARESACAQDVSAAPVDALLPARLSEWLDQAAATDEPAGRRLRSSLARLRASRGGARARARRGRHALRGRAAASRRGSPPRSCATRWNSRGRRPDSPPLERRGSAEGRAGPARRDSRPAGAAGARAGRRIRVDAGSRDRASARRPRSRARDALPRAPRDVSDVRCRGCGTWPSGCPPSWRSAWSDRRRVRMAQHDGRAIAARGDG